MRKFVASENGISRKEFLVTKRFFLLVNLCIPSFQLECLVATDIIFDRNTGGKHLKFEYLSQT